MILRMTHALEAIHLSEVVEPEFARFSDRLRSLRSDKGWTLEELAERSGLSKPFLSRLEAGNRHPSIAAILTLSRVFGVSIGSFFDRPPDKSPCVIVRADDARLQKGDGLTYAALSNASRFANLQPIHLWVSATRQGDERFQHEGEEWVYIISGTLKLLLGDAEYVLKIGDAAHFDSRLPHRLVAMNGKNVEAIVVACPLPESSTQQLPQLSRSRRAIR
jgi:transcriptional regulator with XRE-family HTH domain